MVSLPLVSETEGARRLRSGEPFASAGDDHRSPKASAATIVAIAVLIAQRRVRCRTCRSWRLALELRLTSSPARSVSRGPAPSAGLCFVGGMLMRPARHASDRLAKQICLHCFNHLAGAGTCAARFEWAAPSRSALSRDSCPNATLSFR